MPYLLCLLFAFSQFAYAKTYPVKIGSSTIYIIKEQQGRGKNFVHLHANEVTALKAAKTYIKQHGGSVISLKHSAKRTISFYLKGDYYEFDPNRIFTDMGIQKTLKLYGHYSKGGHMAVKQFANKILSLLPEGKIIAVHNNKGYSLKEYFPKESLASDASAIHYKVNSSARNFYFVTEKNEFNRLKRLNFNVVLQADNPNNDGSLSYYLAKKNYVNIEAAFDEFAAQLKMIASA